MGLKGIWNSAISILDDILTTKGDLISFSTLPLRVGVGANDTVLTADSTQASGIKWAAVSSSTGAAIQQIAKTSNETLTTPTTFTDVAGVTATLPASGKAIVTCVVNFEASAADHIYLTLADAGTAVQTTQKNKLAVLGQPEFMVTSYAVTCAGQIVKAQMKVASGNITAYGSATVQCCILTVLSVNA